MAGERILVVEDEANIVNLVRAYLEREGFAVKTVSDGRAALQQVHAARPDLIILDLMLPGIDGLEVCRRVRQESDVYIIMLTAKAEESDRIVGLELGADDYLTKPFSPRELVARVKAVLRRRREGRSPSTLRAAASLRAASRSISRRSSSTCCAPSLATPGSSSAARSCSSGCGATTTSATNASSTCTLACCARKSRPTRPSLCCSRPCAA